VSKRGRGTTRIKKQNNFSSKEGYGQGGPQMQGHPSKVITWEDREATGRNLGGREEMADHTQWKRRRVNHR